jgi:hypothetical protein
MEATFPFGKVHGFVFILAWSRYLFVRFYPRSSMEFFLDGHIRAYAEIKGAARENWYDNLKSVVVTRRPELVFNSQFVDYTRHMGISLYACNPGEGNEKGRVERAIRDIRNFIEAHGYPRPQRKDGPVEKREKRACPSHGPKDTGIRAHGREAPPLAGHPL